MGLQCTHVRLYEAECPDAVLGELPPQEAVGEEDLSDDVDEVEELGEHDAVGPADVAPLRLDDVLGQLVLRTLAVVRPQNPVVEAAEDGLNNTEITGRCSFMVADKHCMMRLLWNISLD